MNLRPSIFLLILGTFFMAGYSFYQGNGVNALTFLVVGLLLCWIVSLEDELDFKKRNEIIATELIYSLSQDLEKYESPEHVQVVCSKAVQRGMQIHLRGIVDGGADTSL
jgi:hypothetical protein